MKDRIHALQGAIDGLLIAHIAVNKFGFRIHVLRRTVAVDLRNQQIKDAHSVALLDECIGKMRPNKAGASGNQDVQLFQCLSRGKIWIKTR